MTQFRRELVSRGTAAVVALLLLYGGWRCAAKGAALSREARTEAARADGPYGGRAGPRATGAGPVYVVGAVLALGGLPLAGVALLPTRWIYRVFAYRHGDDERNADRMRGAFDVLSRL